MDAEPRRPGRLLWSLRQYGWVAFACVLAGAAAPPLLGTDQPTYQARAVVVAQQLIISSKALPQLAETVFADVAVAARIADDPVLGGTGGNVIPDQLSVVAPEDSIALVVQARNPDPGTAARLADAAAETFVAELNRGGAGVGQFAVQGPAVVPTEPMATLPASFQMAIGALAGLVLGVGIVALIGTLRRPVISSEDVETAVGVPLLGTVQLPSGPHGYYPGPLGIRGIATVTRWLASVPAARLLLISPSSAVAIRQRIYVMTAVALSAVRRVRLAAPQELVDAVGRHRTGLRDAGRPVKPSRGSGDDLLLVDGGSPLEIVDPAASPVSVVVVAPRGISRRHLRAVTSEYLDAGLVGVVLVDLRRALRRAVARRARSAAVPAPAGSVPVGVPEPERA